MKNLSEYDFIVAIDRSGSMLDPHKSGVSRFEAAQEAAVAVARKGEQHDTDGITAYCFANTFKRFDNTKADTVANIFKENEPGGGTNTAGVLADIFANHLTQIGDGQMWDGKGDGPKPGQKRGSILFMFTDGAPNNEEAVAKEIVNFTKKLNHNDQFAIQFAQIGDDVRAKKFLDYLDDNLEDQGAQFDIVDTTPESEIGDLSFADWVEKTLTD